MTDTTIELPVTKRRLFSRPDEDERRDFRLRFDRCFHHACLETSLTLEKDPEVQRLAGEVLKAEALDEADAAYRKIEENVDRKLRALLSVREKGRRFEGLAISLIAHVCPNRRRLLLTAMIRKSYAVSRQSIECAVTEKGGE